MLEQILTLSQKFIAIKSTPDNPVALEEILELALTNLEGFTIERFEKNGVKSALIYPSKKRPKKFKIILNGHLDVIPGKDFQYQPKVKANKLYGVGSMDMKANAACLILAFREMAKRVNYPLALQLVTDEEVGGFNGTKYQIKKGVRAEFVIAGEPTNLNIVNKAKGVLWLKISSKGRSAHGAYPWRGKNAVWQMNSFLNLLQKHYPIPSQEQWITTINLSNIKTNNKSFNKIPDYCTVWLDTRYVPEEKDTVTENIRKLLPKGFTLEIVAKEPALYVAEDDPYIKKLQNVVKQVTKKMPRLYGAQGSSDARHFTQVNCSGVEFGPSGGGIGSDQEWVDIPSLEQYYTVLTKLLSQL